MHDIMWTISYGTYHIDHIIWFISYGPYHMETISYSNHEPYQMPDILWYISYGPYHMVHIKWKILNSSYDIDHIVWFIYNCPNSKVNKELSILPRCSRTNFALSTNSAAIEKYLQIILTRIILLSTD